MDNQGDVPMVGDHQAQQVGQGPEQVVEQGVGNNPRENRPPGEVAVGQPATGEGQQNVAGAIPRTGQGIHEDKVDIVQGRPQKRGRAMTGGAQTVAFEVPEGMSMNGVREDDRPGRCLCDGPTLMDLMPASRLDKLKHDINLSYPKEERLGYIRGFVGGVLLKILVDSNCRGGSICSKNRKCE